MRLFCAMKLLRDSAAEGSVTLGIETQFIGAGDAARPLDCVVEVLRETRRLAFLRGLVEQGEQTIWSPRSRARIRKPSHRPR